MTTNDTTGRVKAPKAGNHLRLPEPAEREPADTTGSNQLTPNGSAHHLTQHPGNPDPRAIAVARAVLEREDPEFVILFGSRARGDYDDAESDIDLMLVTSRAPGEDSEEHHMAEPSYRSLRPGTAATVRAEEKAREAYRRPVPVQLVWITPGEYRINRVYENSLESIAASEGILMPRDPESYSRRDFEDEETGYAHDWTRFDERVEDALGFLEALEGMPNRENPQRDRVIGLNCQRGVEHSMKALLEAWKGQEGEHERNRYRENHNVSLLLGQVRRADPEMAELRLEVTAEVHDGYRGRRAYTGRSPERMITMQGRGADRTMEDIARILLRAKEIRESA